MNNLKKDVNEMSNSIQVIKDNIIETKQEQEKITHNFNHLSKQVGEIHKILM